MSGDEQLIDLPPLREIIARHNLRAEKKLGQNFLLDGNITDKIARIAGNLSGSHVFEIGPGPGGLTRSLLKAGATHVTAVEFDPRAVAALAELSAACSDRLTVLEADALTTDLTVLASAPRRIVANLPYNIATPLLIGWLRQLHADKQAFAGMTLMFQREVADRIIAVPNTKTYGRLSVLCQWLCQVKRMFDIPGAAFVPPPKVTSSVVHFTPRALSDAEPEFATVEALTAAAFGQRRKMLRSSLADHAGALEALGIDPSLRAEALSVSDFIRLARFIDSGPPRR